MYHLLVPILTGESAGVLVPAAPDAAVLLLGAAIEVGSPVTSPPRVLRSPRAAVVVAVPVAVPVIPAVAVVVVPDNVIKRSEGSLAIFVMDLINKVQSISEELVRAGFFDLMAEVVPVPMSVPVSVPVAVPVPVPVSVAAVAVVVGNVGVHVVVDG